MTVVASAVGVVIGAGSWGQRRGRWWRRPVSVLDRVEGRRRRPSSPDDADPAPVYTRCILSLFQPAKAWRLVLLVLRAAVTATARRPLEAAWWEAAAGGRAEHVGRLVR